MDEELAQRVADGVNTETTRKQYADRVRFQITPLLGGVRLRELSAMHIRQWQTTLAKQGAYPSLRRRSLAILKTALERAVRYELIPANPAKLVDPPTVQRTRRAVVTVDTARALLRAAEGDELEAAYVLALHVPMRVGEVIAIEWDCHELERGPARRPPIPRARGRSLGAARHQDPTAPGVSSCPSASRPRCAASAPARPPSALQPAPPGRHLTSLTSVVGNGVSRTSSSPARPASPTCSRASTSGFTTSALAPRSHPSPPTTSAAPQIHCYAPPAWTRRSSASSPAVMR